MAINSIGYRQMIRTRFQLGWIYKKRSWMSWQTRPRKLSITGCNVGLWGEIQKSWLQEESDAAYFLEIEVPAQEKKIKSSSFYRGEASEWASAMAFGILLHIRNKFEYTTYKMKSIPFGRPCQKLISHQHYTRRTKCSCVIASDQREGSNLSFKIRHWGACSERGEESPGLLRLRPEHHFVQASPRNRYAPRNDNSIRAFIVLKIGGIFLDHSFIVT